MPDEQFANPRLVELYDAIEGDRADLDHYRAIVAERGARSVLDIGCGTGALACLLAADGATWPRSSSATTVGGPCSTASPMRSGPAAHSPPAER